MVRGGIQGTGIGLRGPHLPGLHARRPDLPWLELLADNYIDLPADELTPLEDLRADTGMTLHCVNMSVAGPDPIDVAYIDRVRALAHRLDIELVSDHLCWSSLDGYTYHDLLPFPFHEESLLHVSERVERLQEQLRRPLILENVSAYVGFASSDATEAEFLTELVRRTGCRILLDLNNLYINHHNLDVDVSHALQQIPLRDVAYLHLSGHRDETALLVDTHDTEISEPVWRLLGEVLTRRPDLPALIEWDHELPKLEVLLDQQQTAERLRSELMSRRVA